MKFSKLSQLALVSSLGLLVATLLSGCLLVTLDYVFVACSSGNSAVSPGQIQTFAADGESGALRPVDTPVPSGGNQPVAMATSADYANLYVANAGNNSVVHFAINNDGSLTQKDTVTAPFTPTGLAVGSSTAGTGLDLYVVGGSNPGHVAVYTLSSGTIGSLATNLSLSLPGFATDSIAPTAVNVLVNDSAVYVTAYDQSAYNPGGTVTSSANPGWVYGFNVGASGALTAVNGSPFQAGIKPVAIASDPTNRFVYATDYASNQLIGYGVQAGNSLEFMLNGPFKTGNEPTSVAVDPRGLYIYASDSLQNAVSAFTITLATGSPTAVTNVTGGGGNITDTSPVSILVDPALGRYVYTANNLGNTISGFRLNPNTGALTATEDTPYPTGANPTAIVAVPHGNHAIQTVYP